MDKATIELSGWSGSYLRGEKAKSGYFIILDDISKVLIESMMLISVFVICCGAKNRCKDSPCPRGQMCLESQNSIFWRPTALMWWPEVTAPPVWCVSSVPPPPAVCAIFPNFTFQSSSIKTTNVWRRNKNRFALSDTVTTLKNGGKMQPLSQIMIPFCEDQQAYNI